MVTPGLINYINKQLSVGTTIESIKSALLRSGWQANDIEDAFTQRTPANQPTANPVPTFSANNIPPEISVKKPVIIYVLTGLFIILTIAMIPVAFIGPILILISNEALTKTIPGSLPFSFIRDMPLLFVPCLLGLSPFILSLTAVFRVYTGSKSAWKTSFIYLILIMVIGFLTGMITAGMMNNYGSNF